MSAAKASQADNTQRSTHGVEANPSLGRLTVSQRILAALPTLKRPPSEASRKQAQKTNGNGSARDEAGVRTGREKLRDALLKPPQATADDKAGGKSDDEPSKKAGARSKTSSAKGADRYADVPTAELRHRIKYLDDRERLYALIAAPIGMALNLTIVIRSYLANPAHGKLHLSSTALALQTAIFLFFPIALLVSALFRRRSFSTASLFFVGFSGLGDLLYALPFWGLGAMFFWRSMKMQNSLTARGEGPDRSRREARSSSRSARSGPPRSASRPQSLREAHSRGASAARRKRKEQAPTGPSPNKRYTPPKPRRPKPPAQ